MSTEVDYAPPDVVHPVTGEAITLATATDDQLARFLSEVRKFEGLLKDAKFQVNREALRRMDAAVLAGREKGWTQRVGPWTLSAPSTAAPTEYDGEGLHSDLSGLARDEIIGFEAVDRVITLHTEYKVNRGQLNALAKACPAVAEAARARLSEVDKPRYVKVTRS